METNNQVSKCCGAEVRENMSLLILGYKGYKYRCKKCGKPCEVAPEQVRCPPDFENKLFCGRCREWVDIRQAEAHAKKCWKPCVPASPEKVSDCHLAEIYWQHERANCLECFKECKAVDVKSKGVSPASPEPPKFGSLTRREFLALPMEERVKRLQESAIRFAKENPDYYGSVSNNDGCMSGEATCEPSPASPEPAQNPYQPDWVKLKGNVHHYCVNNLGAKAFTKIERSKIESAICEYIDKEIRPLQEGWDACKKAMADLMLTKEDVDFVVKKIKAPFVDDFSCLTVHNPLECPECKLVMSIIAKLKKQSELEVSK